MDKRRSNARLARDADRRRERCVGFAKHHIDEGHCRGAGALNQIIRFRHVARVGQVGTRNLA